MGTLVYSEAVLESLAIHFTGNKQQGGTLNLSGDVTDIPQGTEKLLTDYFLSPFKSNEYYCFWHESELELNEVFTYCTQIFQHPGKFLKSSQNIAKHLYAQSTHPKIKEGELCIAYLRFCNVDGTDCDAVAIFKAESKESVLKTKYKEGSYVLSQVEGISLNKLDKACIVFNINEAEGYKVCVYDQGAKSGEEAYYWKNSFLQVRLAGDEHNNTNHFLKLTKSFITKALAEENELSKTEQGELLDRSLKYFKEKEIFDSKEFERKVFGDESAVIDAFNNFGAAYVTSNDIDLAASFPISAQAVKAQAKNYRSVLKLDKNFHVYIHGNPSMIEKGTDETGRKYYKLYYDEEL